MILGLDTHAEVHVAAVITVLGVLLGTRSFPPPPPATRRCWTGPAATESCAEPGWRAPAPTAPPSTGTWARDNVQVIEVNRPDRAVRRRRDKTDAIDAENATRAVLTAQAKRGDGAVEMIRLFKIVKDSATKARPQTINQLRAVLVRAEPAVRETLTGLGLCTVPVTYRANRSSWPRRGGRAPGRGRRPPRARCSGAGSRQTGSRRTR
ncbi:IS110 family transposase [Saccharothrix deserti]|uniref:IS110 family transposase n=1 Tax=Saccharothrix deserti TaxID=2593674 RepID=UPI0030842825